jgi:hypothetical protein
MGQLVASQSSRDEASPGGSNGPFTLAEAVDTCYVEHVDGRNVRKEATQCCCPQGDEAVDAAERCVCMENVVWNSEGREEDVQYSWKSDRAVEQELSDIVPGHLVASC